MSVCKTGGVEPSKSQFLSKFQKRVLGSAFVLWLLSVFLISIFTAVVWRTEFSERMGKRAVFSWECSVSPWVDAPAQLCKRLFLRTDLIMLSGMVVLAVAIAFVVLARIWSPKDEA